MKIKDRYKNDAHALYNIAVSLIDKGKQDDGELYFEEAIKASSAGYDIPLAYAGYIYEKIEKAREQRFGLNSNQVQQLKKGEEVVSKVIDLLEEKVNRGKAWSDALVLRACIRINLDRFSLAKEDLDKVTSVDNNFIPAYLNRARLYMITKKYDEASLDFELALDKGAKIQDTMPLLMISLIDRPEPNPLKAIQMFKKIHKEDYENADVLQQSLLAECYLMSGDQKETKRIIERLYKQFGRDPRIILTEANLKKNENDLKTYEALSKEVIKSASGKEKVSAIAQLALYYKSRKQYIDAIPYYEQLISEYQFDDFMKDYLVCLYSSHKKKRDNLTKCKDVCDQILENSGEQIFVLELKASILQIMDQLEESQNVYKRLMEIDPDNMRHKVNFAAMQIEIGENIEGGKAILLDIYDKVNDLESLKIVAKFLLRTEEYNKAIEVAYKAYEVDPGNSETQLLYIHTLMFKSNKKDAFLEPDETGLDVYIKVKRNNQNEEYYISDNPKADFVKSEVFIDSPFGKQLIGKKKGEKIIVDHVHGEREVIEILEIKSKYVKVFQTILSNYNTLFPDNNEIIRMSAEPEKILEQTKKISDRASQIMSMYQDKQLTIGAMASFMNRGLVETWGALSGQKRIKLYCSSGGKDEQDQENAIVSNSKEVLIDLVSILTLAHLDELDLLTKVFDKVYVARATLDEIDFTIGLEKINLGRGGYFTLSYQDGKPVRYEISENEVRRKMQFLERIKESIIRNMQVVGFKESLSEEFEKKSEVLSLPYSSTIQVSLENDLPMYCDDLLFRQLIKNEYKIQSFSTFGVLRKALISRVITKEQYCEIVIKLAGIGYHYISISAELLMYCFKTTHLNVERLEDFHVLLDSLNSPETTTDSLLFVLSEFMRLVYLEYEDTQTRREVLNKVLDIIASRGDLRGLLKFFRDILVSRLNLAKWLITVIDKDIKNWLKSQIIY